MKRRLVLTGAFASTLVLGGCATVPSSFQAPASASWSGRLTLKVESDPPQSLAALFDLKGSAAAGELVLTTPLGGTIAAINWSPEGATLRDGRNTRQYASVDALLAEVTGTGVPVAALFDWLAGKDTSVDGWQADLSQHASGRLQAKRTTPAPAADLRIAFGQ